MISEFALQSIKKMCDGHENIKFTVAVMQDGIIEKHLFGSDGVELPYKEYHYEIGSITKTFTAALLAKAIKEEIVSLEDSIDKFIPELEKGKTYPTLKRLITHTSGYPKDTVEFEEEFSRRDSENLFNRYTYKSMLQIIQDIEIEDKDYEANYSNFGIGTLAVALEKAYGKSIHDLIQELLCELDLKETFIGFDRCQRIDLEGYDTDDKTTGNTLWNTDCIIGPAGYLFSTAEDLLKYAKNQIEDGTGYLSMCHNNLSPYQRDGGIPIDIGFCWRIVPDLDIIFHNGGTKSFHTIVCMNKSSNTAVIMLCNYMVEDVSNNAINYLVELTQK